MPEETTPAIAPAPDAGPAALRYLRRNLALLVGLILLGALAAFVGIGHVVVDTAMMISTRSPGTVSPTSTTPRITASTVPR